ncbi:MAG TPA: SAM-dependent methyltransferase [Gammaproteobacteria bacterium]
MSGKSRVYMIRAGSGAIEHLTDKMVRLIQHADVVVYDHLVATELLTLIPCGTARILAGSPYGTHSPHELHQLLLQLVPGRCVVYLKGCKPTLSGCGDEENHYLAHYGIDCELLLDAAPHES